MANSLVDSLMEMLTPALAVLGYELVGCELHRQGRRTLIRVYIDSPTGVTVGDCTQASRQINAILEVEDLIAGDYELEVSSPGVERPLFKPEHYQRFVGKQVKLRLRLPQNDRRNFSGLIQAADNDNVTVVGEEGQTWIFAFSDIEKANIAETK